MTSRIQQLRNTFSKESLDAILISSLPNITYLTEFSGFSTEDRDAFLVITKTKQYIFTHGIYKESVLQQIPDFELIEIKREQPVSKSLKDIFDSEKITKLGFEANDLTVAEYNKFCDVIPRASFCPAAQINTLRLVKSKEEITALQKACTLGDAIFTEMLAEVKTGITEKQLAAILEYKVKTRNADISFPTIIAFGENAAHPHHVPGDKKLAKDTFVLMDFGVRVNNYVSDMTRTVFFGKANNKQKNVYETVLEAQQKAIDFIVDSYSSSDQRESRSRFSTSSNNTTVNAAHVDKVARDYIVSQNFPQMPHSLGHGIGIEVHEAPHLTPSSKETLTNGMVFSIEPGIYLPGDMGVRIEDLFALQDNQLVQLTNSPRNLIEL